MQRIRDVMYVTVKSGLQFNLNKKKIRKLKEIRIKLEKFKDPQQIIVMDERERRKAS